MADDEKPKRTPPSQENWHNLPVTPYRLQLLFKAERLPIETWKRSQQLAGFIPTRTDWLRFADLLMASMGTIFLLAGIVFFFAFNWDDLSKWNRFAIVEGAVVIATVLAFVLNLDKWGGRLALGAATILMGVAFVVVSQEYQTGADSYRLFQIWLMLITGWVLMSRWNIMYLIWMILLNITIGFYWQQRVGTDWGTYNLIVISINFAFVLAWDLIARFTPIEFMQKGRWFLYIFIVVGLIHATTLMVDYILNIAQEYSQLIMPASPFVYLTMITIILVVYSTICRDLLTLTFTALSILVVGVTASGRFIWDMLFEQSADPYFFFLIMGIITIGLTAALATGLRRLHRAWELQND
jgi:uncharacterized membrane protein